MNKIFIMGTLKFHQWFLPWALENPKEKSRDVFKYVQIMLRHMNGKNVSLNEGIECFCLRVDDHSNQLLRYREEEGRSYVSLIGPKKETDLSIVISTALHRINSRHVCFGISIDEMIVEVVDDGQKIIKLPYTHNNLARIPEDVLNSTCKFGSNDECIFCSQVADGKPFCFKGSDVAESILIAAYKGGLGKLRIGNCLITGRESSPEERFEITHFQKN